MSVSQYSYRLAFINGIGSVINPFSTMSFKDIPEYPDELLVAFSDVGDVLVDAIEEEAEELGEPIRLKRICDQKEFTFDT